MSYVLTMTKRAKDSFAQNLDYLEKEWGVGVTNDFIDTVEKVFETIKERPYLYPYYSSSQKIRRCIVHKRIIMFYRISGDNKVSILLFWNTWQDPDRMRLKL